jgi:hypothetical protein
LVFVQCSGWCLNRAWIAVERGGGGAGKEKEGKVAREEKNKGKIQE